MLGEKTIYNALPKLPGFNFSELHQPVSYGKLQYCTFDDEATRSVLERNNVAAGAAPLIDAGGCGLPVSTILNRFPDWKTLDNKVLRFFGFFREAVSESAIETSRIRKVKMHYYLADGTIMIAETPALVNTGLRRGTTVTRYKPEGIDVFSFCIGGSISCRGLTYDLVDCDAATREFYEVMGMPQPDPLDYPFDTFEDKATRPPPPMDEQHTAMRRVLEMQAAANAGTHTSLMTPEERTKARDFFEHDREVLSFNAVWDRRKFRVQYYLADGSISVMFEPADNDGRERHAVFVRRTRVPKNTKAALLETETLSRPQGPAPPYIGVEDLFPGATVEIFTRPFFIYDCDDFTREYLRERGMNAHPHPHPSTEHDDYAAEKARRSRKGIASAASSPTKGTSNYGASSMVFNGSPRKKDPLKMTRFSQDVFRFVAKMVNPVPCNEGRVFLISYYLADDTVSVYELPVRNSGHLGGKIFARREVPHLQDPKNLQVGHVVHLDGVDYILESFDERTRWYLEMGIPEGLEESYFRTCSLLAQLQQGTLSRFSRTADIFRHYASSSARGLTRENVEEMFTDANIRCTKEEMDAIFERVDSDQDGWVSLPDFTERLLGLQFRSDFQPRRTLAGALASGEANQKQVVRGPIQSAERIARSEHAVRTAEEALKNFLTLMEARRTLMVRSFRSAAAETYDGNLGVEDFTNCIRRRLLLSLSDDELGALIYRFFYAPGIVEWTARRLPYKEVHHLIQL